MKVGKEEVPQLRPHTSQWDIEEDTLAHRQTKRHEFNPFTETPFNSSANREDPYQAALVRAALSGSTLFAYENMIRYEPTLVDLTSHVQT